jgi:hypothetical protein
VQTLDHQQALIDLVAARISGAKEEMEKEEEATTTDDLLSAVYAIYFVIACRRQPHHKHQQLAQAESDEDREDKNVIFKISFLKELIELLQ